MGAHGGYSGDEGVALANGLSTNRGARPWGVRQHGEGMEMDKEWDWWVVNCGEKEIDFSLGLRIL